MAREVDLTQKLSEADREYLLARGKEQQVFANDAKFSDDPEALARALYIPGTAIDQAEGVPETPNEPFDDDGDGDDGDDADGDNYDTWSKDELKSEIDNRNEDRDEDDQMAVSGTKAELIARLREDDQVEEDPGA